ncbi:hypothetical protein H6A30_13370 [Bacteroides caecigallinarum]|uniref:hypothetical protein n=1 Tax=Bacteroides caecigallinarum TaxID=1411144 RepID=UPI00195651C9|nr:hypothetical protein [Bacteroides caecigallinarum]MBM6891224.1 hypothetical protein [Bacteroides caecigallinarum]
MRNIVTLLFSSVLIVSLFIACNGNEKYISGAMTNNDYNGCKAYLYTMLPEYRLVDSTVIDGTEFGFDIPDSLSLYKVKVAKSNDDMFPVVVPLVSGEGKVSIYMGDKVVTAGTPSNDRLQDFLLALDGFYETAINSGKTKEEVVNEFRTFLAEQVKFNSNNIVSVYIITEFRSRFAPEVYDDLVAGLNKNIRNLLD